MNMAQIRLIFAEDVLAWYTQAYSRMACNRDPIFATQKV
jgi:hypothetical protein